MARKSNLPQTANTSTSLSTIDAELSNEAALLKKQIDAPSGNKLRIEVVGDIVLPDGTNLGNEIDVVVVDFYNRNFFYLSAYNPQASAPPDCYAIGKDLSTMAPEADSPDKQSASCVVCPMNQYKSAKNGTAKACQNRYWLAVLIVDPDNPDAHNQPGAPIYTLDLSPTNRKTFEAAATYAANSLGSVIKAKFTVTAQNVGTYAKITFSSPLPNPDYAAHYARRPEVQAALTRKPDFAAYEAPAAGRRGSNASPARRQASPPRR